MFLKDSGDEKSMIISSFDEKLKNNVSINLVNENLFAEYKEKILQYDIQVNELTSNMNRYNDELQLLRVSEDEKKYDNWFS